jgi:ABC-type multidrug transport system fused ATPase/permease subunit
VKTLHRIWSILDRHQRRQLLALLGLGVLMAFSTLVGIAAVLPFFTALADPQLIHRQPLLDALFRRLAMTDERQFMGALGIALVALVLAGNVINLFGARAIGRYAQTVGSQLCCALFAEYLRRDFGFHARTDTSALATKVQFEAGRVATGIIEHGLILASSVVTIAMVVATTVLLNPFVALFASSTLGLSYALIYLIARRKLRRNGKLESALLATRGKVVHEGFGAIKEIIATQSQPYFFRKFARASESLADTLTDTKSIAQSPKYILECLTVAGLVGVALSLGTQTRNGVPWLAQLTFFGFAAYRLLPALQQVFHAAVKIRVNTPALDGIIGDLRAAGTGPLRIALSQTAWRGRPRRDIRLIDVTFRYASDLPLVVNVASLRIPAGSITALVGHNGAGKTALADLILGLLIPTSGRVEIDGIAIDAATRHAWQPAVAYVPQQVFLLDASIAENIAFGFTGAQIDVPRMHEAAMLARLADFVAALPSAYETTLGEDGIRLSGGMRQRIGIARALYRDASVLVLDEATSALDANAEDAVLATLEGLRGARTIIVITHSEHVVRIADEVFELIEGSVAARGAASSRRTVGAGRDIRTTVR